MSAAPYWPAGLPEPLIGYSQQTALGLIETEGDIHPVERPIASNYRKTASVSFLFTEQQYQVFIAWHFHRLHDGVDWFDCNWGGEPARCQFVKNYSARQQNLNREVSAEVELDYSLS